MGQNTIYSAGGFLPYGVADDSIVFRSSLTSQVAAETPEIGGAVVVTTTNGSFDSVKGFNPGGNGGIFYNDLTNYATLDDGFQIYIEVEKELLCSYVNDLTNGVLSGGSVSGTGTSQEAIFSCNTGGGAFRLHRDDLSLQLLNPDATLTGLRVYSPGKSDFIPVQLGYSGYGDAMTLAVDGCILGTITGTDSGSGTDMIRDLYVGNHFNTNRHIQDNYVRNLQISNRAPCFPTHPRLAKIAILSDSMFNTDDVSGGANKDVSASWTLRRELAKRGLFTGNAKDVSASGAMYVGINSGDTWAAGGGGADDLQDQNATILAENPNIIIIRGGTNDIISGVTIDSSWEAEIQSHCDTLLAGDHTEYIVVGTIPSTIGSASDYTAAKIAATNQANAYIRALPSHDSRIVVADCFEALGGHDPATNTFKGQIAGYANEDNDLHPAGLGHYLMGKCYADAIMTVLG